MDKQLFIIIVAFLILISGCKNQDNGNAINNTNEAKEMNALDIGGVKLYLLGHSSVQIVGTQVIYIDPFRITGGQKADIIAITHEHFDHCSPEDVKKIMKDSTVIIAPQDCAVKLSQYGAIKSIVPGQSLNISGILIDAVPAYNINKPHHPKGNNWVGYIITIDGKRIYHAGDTDKIQEMSKLKDIDVALLPVGGGPTMNATEAADAASIINPKIAVPMHYGSVVGTKADGAAFKQAYSGESRVL